MLVEGEQEEGEGRPLLLDNPIIIGQRGGARMDDQLDQLDAITDSPCGPKGPAKADRKVRDFPVPSRLRSGVREARAAERANEERKRRDEPQRQRHPQFPRTGQVKKAW